MVVFTLIALLLFQMKAAEHKVVSIKASRCNKQNEMQSLIKLIYRIKKQMYLWIHCPYWSIFDYAGGRYTDGNSLWGMLHLLVGNGGSYVVPVIRLQCTHHKHPAVIIAGETLEKDIFNFCRFLIKHEELIFA